MKKTILLALWLWAATAGGHTLPISYLLLVPDADYLHLELTLNPFELNSLAGLDPGQEIRLGGDQPGSKPSGLSRQILDCLEVRVDGQRVQAEVAGLGADPDSHHLTLRAHYRVDARSAPIAVESKLTSVMGISHLTQVICLRAGREQLAQLTGPSAAVVFAAFRATPASTTAPTRHPAGSSTALLVTVMVAFPCAGFAVAMFLTALFHRTKPWPDAFINRPPLRAQQPLACAHSFAGSAKTSGPYA
jgi:hypothetical protein